MSAFTKLNLKNSLNYFLSKIGIINNTKNEEKRISKAVGIFYPFDCINGIKSSLVVFPKSSNTIIYLLHDFIRGFQYYDGEDVFENLKRAILWN